MSFQVYTEKKRKKILKALRLINRDYILHPFHWVVASYDYIVHKSVSYFLFSISVLHIAIFLLEQGKTTDIH